MHFAESRLLYPVNVLDSEAGSAQHTPCAVHHRKTRGSCPWCIAVNDWVGRKMCSFSGKLGKGDVRSRSACLARSCLQCANVPGGPHLTLNALGFLSTLSSP